MPARAQPVGTLCQLDWPCQRPDKNTARAFLPLQFTARNKLLIVSLILIHFIYLNLFHLTHFPSTVPMRTCTSIYMYKQVGRLHRSHSVIHNYPYNCLITCNLCEQVTNTDTLMIKSQN